MNSVFPPLPAAFDPAPIKNILKERHERYGLADVALWESLLKESALFGLNEAEMEQLGPLREAVEAWQASPDASALKSSTTSAQLTIIHLNRLRLDDLKKALKARGFPYSGQKMELVARCEEVFHGAPVTEEERNQPSFSVWFLNWVDSKFEKFDLDEYRYGRENLMVNVVEEEHVTLQPYSREVVWGAYHEHPNCCVYVANGTIPVFEPQI